MHIALHIFCFGIPALFYFTVIFKPGQDDFGKALSFGVGLLHLLALLFPNNAVYVYACGIYQILIIVVLLYLYEYVKDLVAICFYFISATLIFIYET